MELPTNRSSLIESCEWGRVIVHQSCSKGNCKCKRHSLSFEDVVIIPGKTIKEWNWREFGTSHREIAWYDLKQFIGHVTDLVISKGMEERLQCNSTYIEKLEQENITVHHLISRDAVTRYNELLKEGKKVGLLLHTTC